MISWLPGAAVVIGLASILVSLLPRQLYETNYAEKSNRVLNENLSILSKSTSILVTGANSGLGLATIHHFAQRAVTNPKENVTTTVLMACRSMNKCLDAKKKVWYQAKKFQPDHATLVTKLQLIPLQLDLANRTSISTFAVEIQKELPPGDGDYHVPPLHVMIHNAGVFAPHPQLTYLPEYQNVEVHMGINYMGHVLLTHYIWSNVEAVKHHDPDRQARLVITSAIWTLLPIDPLQGWYADVSNPTALTTRNEFFSSLSHMLWNMRQDARSKEAQLYFASELQVRYPKLVTTSASQPGITRTPIYSNGFQGFPRLVTYFFEKVPLGSMSPSEGALAILLGVLDSTAQYIGPKWFLFGAPVVCSRADNLREGSVHHRAFAQEQSQELWDRTMKLLGIAEFGKKNYVYM